MSRPEYVHCVGFGDAIRTDGKKTWCGFDHGLVEPFFKDIDHAALNGENQGRLIVCPECLSAIIEALNNGYNT